jgi:hypothetical protein
MAKYDKLSNWWEKSMHSIALSAKGSGPVRFLGKSKEIDAKGGRPQQNAFNNTKRLLLPGEVIRQIWRKCRLFHQAAWSHDQGDHC